MASSPNLFDKIKDPNLFILQSKITYGNKDVVSNATWFNDTLHDYINDSIKDIDGVTNISTLNDDLLEETKNEDGESILQIWNNSVIRDLNDVVTDIMETKPVDENYVCYLRDVYKGSIIPGLNNLLDMAGASTETFVKDAKIRKLIEKTSLPLEESYSHYFKFDIQINTYINRLVLGLTSATDWATGYKEKNIDNLNFLWQYLLCFCYLCIVNDGYEKHSPNTLFKSFYYLRNICFSSFATIMGYNSIEYIRYPRWKIGYQEEENSILIFNYFKEQFWDIENFGDIPTDDPYISRTNETEYPYSLSQRMAAMNMSDRPKYVIPRKCKGDTSKEKKQCLSGFQQLFEQRYNSISIEKEVKNLIWRITKFSGDSSHIIYGILIESAIEIHRPSIPIVFLLSERPMLARTTIQKYPENRQIYIRDVKKLTEVKPFLHHQTAHYITQSNKYNCIIRLLQMILFINDNSNTPTLPDGCHTLYDNVVNYSDTKPIINTEDYKFTKGKVRHTIPEFKLYDKYTDILEIINIINRDTDEDYKGKLNETITDITPIYNVVNILDFFSNELKLNGNQEFIKKIKRILPKLTKLCTDRLPRRSGSYIAIYFTDYYKSLKADMMNNDLTEGLMILGNLVDFTKNLANIPFEFAQLLNLCGKNTHIFHLLIQEITKEEKLFESLSQISLNIKSSYDKIKSSSSISEIDWIETNLSKSQDDPIIISKLSNNIQTLMGINSFFEQITELNNTYSLSGRGKTIQNTKRKNKRNNKKMTLKNRFKIKKNSKYNDKLFTSIRNSKAKRKNRFKKFTKNSKLSKMKTLIGGMNSTTQENYDHRYIVIDSLNTYLEHLIHNQPLTKPMTNTDNVPLEGEINTESIKEISGITQDFTHLSDLYQVEGPIVVNIDDVGVEEIICNSNNDWLLNILYLYYDIFIDIIECAVDLKQMGLDDYIDYIITELVDLRFEDRYVTTVGQFFCPEDLKVVIENMKEWCFEFVINIPPEDIDIEEVYIFRRFISSLDIYKWDENTINSNSTIKSVIDNTIEDMNKLGGKKIPLFDEMKQSQKDLLIPKIRELYQFVDISDFNNIRYRFIQEMAHKLSAAAAGGYRDEI